MSNTEKSEPRDLGLRHRYQGDQEGRTGSPAIAEPPDSLTLAAYLDGTLSEAERERVETGLAHSPDDLEVILAARHALADGAGPAPDALVARACAMVPETPAAEGNPLSRLAEAVAGAEGSSGLFWQPVAWSGAAVAVLLACMIGFQLGQSGYAGALSMDQFQARQSGAILGQAAEEFP